MQAIRHQKSDQTFSQDKIEAGTRTSKEEDEGKDTDLESETEIKSQSA